MSPQIDITTVLTCTSTASRSVPSFLDTRAFTNDLGTERVLDSKWWMGGSLGSLPPGPAEVGVCMSTRPITSQERRTLSSSRRRETEERISLDRGWVDLGGGGVGGGGDKNHQWSLDILETYSVSHTWQTLWFSPVVKESDGYSKEDVWKLIKFSFQYNSLT